jgi:hypothetical protein
MEITLCGVEKSPQQIEKSGVAMDLSLPEVSGVEEGRPSR